MADMQLTTIQSNNSSQQLPQLMAPPPRAMPSREDCWSEDATFTLIEAWGQRYIDLNRGNLRQKQWQEVADTVNARHGHVKKARRTDVQCKNRIDTLKKKYKIEKARVLETHGSYKSPWPFFEPLDHLIGNTMPIKKQPPPLAVESPGVGGSSGGAASSPPFAVPLTRINPHHHHQHLQQHQQQRGMSPYMYPSSLGHGGYGGGGVSNQIVRGHPFDNNASNVNHHHSNSNVNGNYGDGGSNNSNNVSVSTPVLPQKRPLVLASVTPSPGKGEQYFRRNYAAAAAAAAREEESEEESEEEEEEEQVRGEVRDEDDDEEDEEVEERGAGRARKDEGEDGIRKLARVIEKFGEVYARVEREKQRQLIELEKQRMQFAKELECQRMQMLVEMQVQLEKIKRAKRSNSDEMYS